MKKYFKLGTALAFSVLLNITPTLVTNVNAEEATTNANIVEKSKENQVVYYANEIAFDDSIIEEEPLEIESKNEVSTAEANNILESAPARAPTNEAQETNTENEVLAAETDAEEETLKIGYLQVVRGQYGSTNSHDWIGIRMSTIATWNQSTLNVYDVDGNKITGDDFSNIEWSIADESIASILSTNSDTGLVTIKGLKGGVTTLTATTKDGSSSQTIEVHVFDFYITIDGNKIENNATYTVYYNQDSPEENEYDYKTVVLGVDSESDIAVKDVYSTSVYTNPRVIDSMDINWEENNYISDGFHKDDDGNIMLDDALANIKLDDENPKYGQGTLIALKPSNNPAQIRYGITFKTPSTTQTIYISANIKVVLLEGINFNNLDNDQKELHLKEGDSTTLTFDVKPKNTEDTYTWTSSNEEVATVVDGVVTAIGEGEATIKVTSDHNANIYDECTVIVSKEDVLATSIIMEEEIYVLDGSTTQIEVEVKPVGTTDKTLIWTSSDESIATVDQNGNVTGLKAGTAVVRATSKGNPDVYAETTVTVISPNVVISNVHLDDNNQETEDKIEDSFTMTYGTASTIKVQLDIPYEDVNAISMSTNNPASLTFDWNNIVKSKNYEDGTTLGRGSIYTQSPKATKTGIATVTVTFDTKYGTFTRTFDVKVEVDEPEYAQDEMYTHVGDTETPELKYYGQKATTVTTTYTSSDESVATVDENGNVTGVSNGTTTITVTAFDEENDITYTDSIVVKVVSKPNIEEVVDENGNTTYIFTAADESSVVTSKDLEGKANVVIDGVPYDSAAINNSKVVNLTIKNLDTIKSEDINSVHTLKTLTLENINTLQDGAVEWNSSLTDLTFNNVGRLEMNSIYQNAKLNVVNGLSTISFLGGGAFTNNDSLTYESITDMDAFATKVKNREISLGWNEFLKGADWIYNSEDGWLKSLFEGKFDINTPEDMTELEVNDDHKNAYDGYKEEYEDPDAINYQTGDNNSTELGNTQITKSSEWTDLDRTIAEVEIQFEQAHTNVDFLFTVDLSYSQVSVGNDETDKESRVYAMQSKMLDVVKQILNSTDSAIALVSFGGYVNPENPGTFDSLSFTKDYSLLASKLYEMNPHNDNTDFITALNMSTELARIHAQMYPNRKLAVVFVSDGLPNVHSYTDEDGNLIADLWYGDNNTKTRAEMIAEIREAADELKEQNNGDIEVYSVLHSVASSAESSTKEIMNVIATNGEVYSVYDNNGFSTAINKAITTAYGYYEITDVVGDDFTLDVDSIQVLDGNGNVIEDAEVQVSEDKKTITWMIRALPYEVYTLKYNEKLTGSNTCDCNCNPDGKEYSYGDFDTNNGNVIAQKLTYHYDTQTMDKEEVNIVDTPTLPRVGAKVIVIYVDEEGNELATSEEYTGLINQDTYTTYAKDIPSYHLVHSYEEEDVAEDGKTYTKTETTVTYVYALNEGTVIIHYIDKNGNTIHEDDTLTGIVGEKYSTNETKETRDEEILSQGYQYLTSTGKVEGTFTEERPINVTYIYEALGKVIVKYIDMDTDEEFTDLREEHSDVADTVYGSAVKEIDGYDFVERTDNYTGTYTKESYSDPIVVIYKYSQQKGKVFVEYVDEAGNPLTDTLTLEGRNGTEYKTYAKDFTGYMLVETPENKDGYFEKDKNQTVTYVYAKNKYDFNTEKDKIATELDENEETTIELILSGQDKTLTSDVVFVLDKSDCNQATVEKANELLDELYAAIEETQATIKIGVVVYGGDAKTSYELTTYTEEEQSNIDTAILNKSGLAGGTNIGSGIEEAIKMLTGDTTVSNNRKYLILISDGLTRLFTQNNELKTIYYQLGKYTDSSSYEGGPTGWSLARNGRDGNYNIPDGLTWDEWWTKVQEYVEQDGDKYVQNYNDYGINPSASKVKEDLESGKFTYVSHDDTEHALSFDRSMVEAEKVWKELVDLGINAYTTTVRNTYGIGEGFLKQLARLAGNDDRLDFQTITDKIINLLGAGSKVVDYVGNSFDLVKDSFELIKNEEVLEKTTIDENTYTFGTKEDGDYRYKVTYNESDESFEWLINENISSFDSVVLRYKEKLVEKAEAMGEYTVPTNEKATLYPVNEEQVGEPEDFPVPEVTYNVVHEGTVIIHYIDKNGNTIREDDTLTGIVGEEYATNDTKTVRDEEILSQGYRYLTSTGKVEGTFTDERPINVTYIYEKLGTVIIKYLDQDTKEEVAEEEKLTGNVGDSYTTSSKQVEHYDLVGEPDNKYGDYTVEEQEVIYYYVKHTGKVIAHYVDNDTNEELEVVEQTGKVGSEYHTEEKEFENYEFVDISGDSDATFEEEDIHIYYYYEKQQSNVNIHYVDKTTGEELETVTTIPGKIGSDYQTKEKEFEHYHLVETSENTEGTYTKEDIDVYYYYERNTGKVIAHYIDKDTEEELTSVEQTGKVGETYTTEQKSFENYEFDSLEGEDNSTYTEEDIHVYYYYVKDSGEVIAIYRDNKTGEEIAEQYTSTGKVDETYETPQKEIEGYRFAFKDGEDSGNYEKDTTIRVTYYYEKLGKVIVKYLDQETEEELKESIEKEGLVNEEYTTNAEVISGYTLVETPENATGRYLEDSYNNPTEVIYYYAKTKGTVITHYVEKDTNKELLEQVTSEDVVGESYKTQEKEIEDYILVGTSNNISGTYTEEEIHVYYYYELKQGTVVAHYVNESGDPLAEEVITNGKIDTEYQTSAKEFDGYELVGTPKNAKGTYTEEEIHVIYVYKEKKEEEDDNKCCNTCCNTCGTNCNSCNNSCQNGLVIARYEDEDGNTIAEEEITYVAENQAYATKKKMIKGYTFVRVEGDPVSGTYTDTTIDVVYIYQKQEEKEPDPEKEIGILVVHYVDEDGNSIADDVITSEVEGTKYVTSQKVIAGYNFVRVTDNYNGVYDNDIIEVTYTYEKIQEEPVEEEETAYVVVRYIDENGAEIAEKEILSGKIGEFYFTTQKVIEGYIYVDVDSEEEGNFEEGITRVTYTYEKVEEEIVEPQEEPKTSYVVVKYVEKDTGKVLSENVVLTGKVGDVYFTSQKVIDGYNFVSSSNNEEGEYSEEITRVIYEYEKIEETPVEPEPVKEIGILVVHYVDQDGNTLVDDIVTREEEGTKYVTSQKAIAGYNFVRVTDNYNGVYDNDIMEVTYTYEKIEEEIIEPEPEKEIGILVVHYVDEDGNTIADDIITSEVEGTKYVTSQKAITGYNFVNVTDNHNGVYDNDIIEVTYTYEKIQEKPVEEEETAYVVVRYIDENGAEIAEKEILSGKIGEFYFTTQKVVEGYIYVDVDSEEEGTFEEGITRVTYTYKKIEEEIVEPEPVKETGILVVHYVDQDGNTISDDIITSEEEGTKYVTSQKAITGYNFVNVTDNYKGVYDNDIIEVTYTYEKIKEEIVEPQEEPKTSYVVVKYVEKDTGKVLSENVVLTGKVGDVYFTSQKVIDGYNFVSSSNNEEGEYSEEITRVIYEYEKEEIEEPTISKGYVIVSYVEKGTEKPLAEEILLTGNEKDFYFTTSKIIDGYELTSQPSNKAGFYTDGMIYVVYEYEKIEEETVEEAKDAVILVQYIDKSNNNPVFDSVTLTGKVGDIYTTARKAKEGYTLVTPDFQEIGKYESEIQSFTYYYEKIEEEIVEPEPVKKTGILVVHYVDQNGNSIADDIITRELEGTKYVTSQKVITGYNFVNVTDNHNGVYDNDIIEVTYTYEKVEDPEETVEEGYIVVHYMDEDGNTIAEDVIIKGNVGDTYITSEKLIDGYTLLDIVKRNNTPVVRLMAFKAPSVVTSPKIGTITSGVTEINYIYQKNAEEVSKNGIIIVHYVDTAGTALAEDVVITGKVGDFYNASQKVFTGYKFVKVDADKTNGNLEEGQKEITYIYEKVEVETPTCEDNSCNCNNSCCNNNCENSGNSQPNINIDININNENNSDNHSENNNQNDVKNDTNVDNHNDINNENNSDINNENNTDVNNENNNQDETNINIENNPTNSNENNNNTNVENNPTNNVENNTDVNNQNENNPVNNNENNNQSSSENNNDNSSSSSSDNNNQNTSENNNENNPTNNNDGSNTNINNNDNSNSCKDNTCENTCPNSSCETNSKQGIVVANYLDENGKVVSTSVTTIEDVDKYYTTNQKDIPGYEFVKVEGETIGKYVEGVITVNYYYKEVEEEPITPEEKEGTVNVHYVDTKGMKLDQDESTTKEVGTDYTTEKKEFDGYTFVNVYGNTNGKYVEGTIEVVYIYEKIEEPAPVEEPKYGTIVTYYVDTKGNTLEEKVVTTSKVGDTYLTDQLAFEGYTFAMVVGNKTGTYQETVTEVTYIYDKIEEEKTCEKDCHTTIEVKCDTCCKDSCEEEKPKTGVVIAYYVDENGKTIATDETSKEEVDTYYATVTKVIDGYELKEIQGEKLGKYIDGIIEVTYVYKEKKTPEPVEEIKTGTITIKYIDTDGNVLKEEVTKREEVGTTYQTTPPTIDGYTYHAVVGIPKGTYTEGNQEIIYIYEKTKEEIKTGKVIIHYVDEKGNTLLEDKTLEGEVGHSYESKEEDIPNYSLIAVTGEENGAYTEETKEITYVYSKKKGTVIAHYVDSNGRMIGYDITEEGYVDEEYTTKTRKFKGYTLIQVVGAYAGKYVDGTIEVTYIYQKDETGSTTGNDEKDTSPSVQPRRVSTATTPSSIYDAIAIPHTGIEDEKNIENIVFLILLVSLTGIVLTKKSIEE